VASTPKAHTRIERAVNDCIATLALGASRGANLLDHIGDDGSTITLDTQGTEDIAGDDVDTVACILGGLNVSDFVTSQIDSTRALDGQRSGSWDGFEAVWSYHPDSGLHIAVHDGR
jgi:hypothetical protein